MEMYMPVTRWDHYQNLRHSQPDLYWASKTQTQMLQEQKQMGNAFYEQYELNLETQDAVG